MGGVCGGMHHGPVSVMSSFPHQWMEKVNRPMRHEVVGGASMGRASSIFPKKTKKEKKTEQEKSNEKEYKVLMSQELQRVCVCVGPGRRVVSLERRLDTGCNTKSYCVCLCVNVLMCVFPRACATGVCVCGCCYCSVRCSLLSPCLDGWFGDGACDGCVTDGSECVTGTPPGTMPSIAAAMPPGATPTMPGGNLNTERLKVKL